MAKIVTQAEQTNRMRVLLVLAIGIAGFIVGRLFDRTERHDPTQDFPAEIVDEETPKPKRTAASSGDAAAEISEDKSPPPAKTAVTEQAVAAVEPDPDPSASPGTEPEEVAIEESPLPEAATESPEPALPATEAEPLDSELAKVYDKIKPQIAAARTLADERGALKKMALRRPLTAIDGLPSASLKRGVTGEMFGIYRGNLRMFTRGRKGRVRIEIREPDLDKPLSWAVLVEVHLDQDTPHAQSTRVTGGLDLLRIAGVEAISLRSSERSFLQLFYRGDDFVGNYYEKANAAAEYTYAGTVKLTRQR
jgi:hypothetical protein